MPKKELNSLVSKELKSLRKMIDKESGWLELDGGYFQLKVMLKQFAEKIYKLK